MKITEPRRLTQSYDTTYAEKLQHAFDTMFEVQGTPLVRAFGGSPNVHFSEGLIALVVKQAVVAMGNSLDPIALTEERDSPQKGVARGK